MRIHGCYYEPEYRAWTNMKKRCERGSRVEKWYGAVSVCPRWRDSYEAFVADVGRRPSKDHSIDRIDPAGDYEPGNVRWADKATQSRNTKIHCTSKTGVRGVTWSNEKLRWRAAIYVNNRQRHIGYFDNLQDAADARAAAEKLYWNH